MIQQLGGKSKVQNGLSRNTEFLKVRAGHIVKIGDNPTLSKQSISRQASDYNILSEKLSRFIDLASEQSMWFDTRHSDEAEQTILWYRRFDI